MFSNSVPHLTPAYGRDYNSRIDVETAFDSDRDFLFHGIPINKSQLVEGGHREVTIRYGNLRKQVIIKFDGHNHIPEMKDLRT